MADKPGKTCRAILGRISGRGVKTLHLHKNLLNKPFINNQIRAARVRVVDEQGKQMGVMGLAEALQLAKERSLDLIQVTERVEPPVCKIADHGKYLYWLQKKEKGAKKAGELKGIRLGFNISPHDLENRVRQAEAFLKKGDKVRVELILRGRQKSLGDFAKSKMQQFIESLQKLTPIKIERELKREPRGFTIIISRA